MSRHPEFPRPVGFDEDYWLCRCEGYRVETPERRLGVVAEIRYRTRIDRPDELVVYGGLFGNRVLLVKTRDIEDVIPRHQRILVRTEAAPASHEPLARLRSYLHATLHGG
jgi:hypothetical protein